MLANRTTRATLPSTEHTWLLETVNAANIWLADFLVLGIRVSENGGSSFHGLLDVAHHLIDIHIEALSAGRVFRKRLHEQGDLGGGRVALTKKYSDPISYSMLIRRRPVNAAPNRSTTRT
jgi:hypothetical protein